VWKEKTMGVEKENSSQKRTSGDAGLEVEKASDLMDTASSPLKSVDEGGGSERTGAKAKKQLMLGYVEDNSDVCIPPPPPEYILPKELKKQRRTGKGGSDISAQGNNVAGFGPERRPQQ
jgi:hypothetical protein